MTASCPVCGAAGLVRSLTTPGILVQRCPDCSHRVAEHVPTAAAVQDYHRQYEEGGFLESLAATRRRQASVIIRLVAGYLEAPDQLLDYGAGRGWFLEACREAGYRSLAGADTSELAVDSLRARGFEALRLPTVTSGPPELYGLTFRPRVLTLLDVVEHFPPPDLRAMLAGLVASLQPELELIVIKVPVADGLLYRAAVRLAKLGVMGPIEQLYQVGTSPPHFNYFSARSMGRLLQLSGMHLLERRGDSDFEGDSLANRARPIRRLPKPAASLFGSTLQSLVDLTGSHDASIFVIKPGIPKS